MYSHCLVNIRVFFLGSLNPTFQLHYSDNTWQKKTSEFGAVLFFAYISYIRVLDNLFVINVH